MKTRSIAAALTLTLLATACSSTYYEIKDPTTGNVYYATEVKSSKGGNVQFQDAASGAGIRLQNSEIRTIDKDTFKQATEGGS